jgi:hypothetical protein
MESVWKCSDIHTNAKGKGKGGVEGEADVDIDVRYCDEALELFGGIEKEGGCMWVGSGSGLVLVMRKIMRWEVGGVWIVCLLSVLRWTGLWMIQNAIVTIR